MDSHDTLSFRLAGILVKLNNGEKLDPHQLAQEYKVNLRTIQRDLNERLGVLPLQHENGLYRLESFYLGKLTLKDIKNFATLAGVSGLFPKLDTDFIRAILDSTISQAYEVKGQFLEDVSQLKPLFEQLQTAILSHKECCFLYKGTEHTVEPYILQLRRELARKEDMANERQLTGWALAQNQQEQARLQADMANVSQQLARRKQQAEAELAAQHVQTIIRHAERAQSQWIRSFDQQSASMTTLLLARVKQYWTNYVEQTLVDRMQEVDGLVAQMQAAPQEKADTLARLQQEAIALNLILKELT